MTDKSDTRGYVLSQTHTHVSLFEHEHLSLTHTHTHTHNTWCPRASALMDIQTGKGLSCSLATVPGPVERTGLNVREKEAAWVHSTTPER